MPIVCPDRQLDIAAAGTTMADNDSIPENPGPLSRKVLEYERIVKSLVLRAKQPGYTKDDWAPLAELIAVDDFERIGIRREVMTWPEYLDFLTQWATSKEFETILRRITEVPGRVFFEIEERHIKGDDVTVINSMNVFEFDDEGRIRHLDVYIQGQLEPTVPTRSPAAASLRPETRSW
jgi:hypothetical protein